MALHKLNVLHWHLTDDQAWRLEIRKYPRLTEVGAWRVPAGAAALHDIDPATGKPRLYGGFYTQAQVRRIVAYAAERNVTIVPEIEMPGHATAAIVAYPQLASIPDPPRQVPADWGIYPNLLNLDEATFSFLEDVLDEVMALFPAPYIHVGGDEAVKDQWRANPKIQARMHELGLPDEQALQGYFARRMARFLHAHGRSLVGWDEILAGGVPEDAIVMSWRGVEGAIAAAAAGHDTVLVPGPDALFRPPPGRFPDEPPGRGACHPGGRLPLRPVAARSRAAGCAPRAGRAGQPLDRAHAHRGARRLHELSRARRRWPKSPGPPAAALDYPDFLARLRPRAAALPGPLASRMRRACSSRRAWSVPASRTAARTWRPAATSWCCRWRMMRRCPGRARSSSSTS